MRLFYRYVSQTLLLSFTVLPLPCTAVPAKQNREAVVLIHGLGRSGKSMRPVARFLKKNGYEPITLSYPSRKKDISSLVDEHIAPALDSLKAQYSPLHFVTHSLGGILLRAYLQTDSLPAESKIIMLGPPNKGSEVNQFFQRFGWYQHFDGPTGQQLGVDSATSIPLQLEPVEATIGIIAGDASWELWSSWWIIPGKDDGKVAVESTKLPEMTDFVTVHRTHTFMMNAKEVHRYILNFLQTSRFKAKGATDKDDS